MAYMGSAPVGLVIFGRGPSPMGRRHRSGAGCHLGDDAGGHRGPDDVVAAVVLAADAIEGLHVDGVRRADGRLQFGAAGNALGHGVHLRVICSFTRIVVKATGAPLRFARDGNAPWTGTQWYAMDSYGLDTSPIHRSAHPLLGMHTIAMDTYPFIAAGARAVDGVFTGRDRRSGRAWAKATRGHGRFSARGGQANDGENARTGALANTPFAAR